MLNFDCDYLEGCHPKILEALNKSNLEQTLGYGEDKYTKSAKEKILKACKIENGEVYFFVGGTQCNSTTINGVLRPSEGVISAESGHINVHESGAVEATNHKVITLKHNMGKLEAKTIKEYLEVFYNDGTYKHMVQPGLVYISHPTEYGTLYTEEELCSLRKVCDEYKLPLFLDGARLGYGLMSENTDVTLEKIAKYCDLFYIGGTKCGALFGEALVVKNTSLFKHFFSVMKQSGAVLAKGRLFGIQFDTLFTNNLYFEISKHAIDMALKIKEAFVSKGYELFMDSPTNQQFITLTKKQLEKITKEVFVRPTDFLEDGRIVVRFTTSWATKEEDVNALINII